MVRSRETSATTLLLINVVANKLINNAANGLQLINNRTRRHFPIRAIPKEVLTPSQTAKNRLLIKGITRVGYIVGVIDAQKGYAMAQTGLAEPGRTI